MNSNISDKDKKDWEKFLSDKNPLPNKDNNLRKKKIGKIKSIDLHGYGLEEANKTIENFILKAHKDGVTKLIVVTGKGLHSQNEKDPYVSKNLGILKHSVPEFIKGSQDLMKKIIKFEDASVEDGGSGAFYIFLKKNV